MYVLNTMYVYLSIYLFSKRVNVILLKSFLLNSHFKSDSNGDTEGACWCLCVFFVRSMMRDIVTPVVVFLFS